MFTTTPCLAERLAGAATMLQASPVAFAEPHEQGVFNIPVKAETSCQFGLGVPKFAQQILNGLGHVTSEELHDILSGPRPAIQGAA